MTSPTMHDPSDRMPFWTVQSVFDPDGGGADFAYTVGLHAHELPELHLWARPDRGLDPGDDWCLSPGDRCHLLNELAWQLVEGRLTIGQNRTQRYDDGETTVEIEIGAPRAREDLEAWGVHVDAQVWPVSWSLHRSPEGAREALTDDAHAQALHDYRTARGLLTSTSPQRAPTGWQPPAEPSFGLDQPFGPRTPVVLARAALLWHASVDDLNALLHNATDVAMTSSLTFPVSMARSAARRAGRRHDLERLIEAVDELMTWVTQGSAFRARWTALCESLWGAEQLRDHRHRIEAERSTANTLRQVLLGALSVEVVADFMDEKWLIAGRGPYLTALGAPAGELPGPEWAASSAAVETVLGLLRPLNAEQLGAVGMLHSLGRQGRVNEWQTYPDVLLSLRAWASTGPAGCPWEGALDSLPVWESVVARLDLGRSSVHLAPLPELQEWASCVTAAITHRAQLDAQQVSVFTEPFVELLPDLPSVLNTPVVGDDPRA